MAIITTFSSSVSPLYYLLKLLGLGSVSLTKSNNFIAIGLYWKLYNFFVLIMLISFGICAVIERLNIPGLKVTAVLGEVMTMVIGLFKAVTAVFLSTMVNNIEQEKLLNNIVQVDTFLLESGDSAYRRTFILILIQITLAYIYVLGLWLFDVFVWNITLGQLSLWCLFTGYPHRLINLACVLEFCDLVLILKGRLHALNLKIGLVLKEVTDNSAVLCNSKPIMPEPNPDIKKVSDQLKSHIYDIRNCYDKLCDINEFINSTHGILLFIELGLAGIELTLALYFLLSTILGITVLDLDAFIVLEIFWISHHIFKLINLTAPCRSAIDEYKKTVMLVQKLLLQKLDNGTARELELFSEQLLHRNIKFVALNFLHMDYSVLLTIFGAVTTYLALVLQYK